MLRRGVWLSMIVVGVLVFIASTVSLNINSGRRQEYNEVAETPLGESTAEQVALGLLSVAAWVVIIGVILALISTLRNRQRRTRCRACAEVVRPEATICKHCGAALAGASF